MLLRRMEENKGGFTLAELLVVVAIIAILVAVSIPIFTGKLEEARENTDLANERAAKAAAVVDFMEEGQPEKYYKFYDVDSGTMIDPETESTSSIKGYNQTKKQADGTNNHAITVTISSSAEGKLDIKLYWHLLK